MAQEKKPKRKQSAAQLANLKPPKKGEVRNPLGGRAHSGPKAQLKKLTREFLADLISTTTNGTVADLEAIAKNPKSTALEVALASSMVKFINKGDWPGLELMLTRVIGKVKDEVDVTSGGQRIENAPQVVVYMAKNGRTKEENQK